MANDPEKILSEMEKILQQLIINAEQLRKLSQQVVSEEQLIPLQRKQEELLKQLKASDSRFIEILEGNTKRYKSQTRVRIGEMLDYFQKLNENFIHNLHSGPGLIQFELKKQGPKKRT